MIFTFLRNATSEFMIVPSLSLADLMCFATNLQHARDTTPGNEVVKHVVTVVTFDNTVGTMADGFFFVD